MYGYVLSALLIFRNYRVRIVDIVVPLKRSRDIPVVHIEEIIISKVIKNESYSIWWVACHGLCVDNC